ncbi:MAG: preprotein translocase subunit SecG [Gammaproteobacteria bacterium]|nr:preprotein translocase subunit SecG [Gammaproteobacteria bacterium]MBT8106397.1 preprotein translocase subunit SecG [Gammaproteobacteria bacterium]NNF48596.1 preprotein translocase subunit SecG [Woeseiaceae bacterium]NNK26412.1 preprotein translocase subunit SecG [Woeseiaceae bacterium]NNL64234.1 preprotein translocase subunit SecG [Woeseiaceae bacterium]
MNNLHTGVLIAHTLIALLIVVLVLLQRGKGADAGAAFGAGASGTVFGARGSSNFFSRATAVCATLFFVSSLALAYLSSQAKDEPTSLLEGAPVVEEAPDTPPELSEETPVSDMPELESAEDTLDLPPLEEEDPDADQG